MHHSTQGTYKVKMDAILVLAAGPQVLPNLEDIPDEDLELSLEVLEKYWGNDERWSAAKPGQRKEMFEGRFGEALARGAAKKKVGGVLDLMRRGGCKIMVYLGLRGRAEGCASGGVLLGDASWEGSCLGMGVGRGRVVGEGSRERSCLGRGVGRGRAWRGELVGVMCLGRGVGRGHVLGEGS